MSTEKNNEAFRKDVLTEIKDIIEELHKLKNIKSNTLLTNLPRANHARKSKAKRKTVKRKPARESKAKRKTVKRKPARKSQS